MHARALPALWLVLSIAACATPPLRTGPRRPAACPDNVTQHCLAGTACAWDDARGCERCRCADPSYVPVGR